MMEALRRQREAVEKSPKAARDLLIKLGLLTPSGKLKKSLTTRSGSRVSR